MFDKPHGFAKYIPKLGVYVRSNLPYSVYERSNLGGRPKDTTGEGISIGG
jgi:hypothetical protein